MLKVVCWNMQHKKVGWEHLAHAAKKDELDIALLQETCCLTSVPDSMDIGPVPSRVTGTSLGCTVVRMSKQVKVQWIHLRETHPGTMCAAQVKLLDGAVPPIIVASMAADSEYPHPVSGGAAKWYCDGPVHRTISDLTRLIGPKTRIIAAGDLNLYPSGIEAHDQRFWSVLNRMKALGVPLAGPSCGGVGDCPTWFNMMMKEKPADAKLQLDYVFASAELKLSVRALNSPDEWCPSDHCAIRIDVEAP